jgi:hypothetical protein
MAIHTIARYIRVLEAGCNRRRAAVALPAAIRMVVDGAVAVSASGSRAAFIGNALRIMSGCLPFFGYKCSGYRRDALAVARVAADALLGSGESRSREALTRIASATGKDRQLKKKQAGYNGSSNFHALIPPFGNSLITFLAGKM